MLLDIFMEGSAVAALLTELNKLNVCHPEAGDNMTHELV
jgi:hypothetical protein